MADIYVRYTEPEANQAALATLKLNVDASVNRDELLVALDDRALAEDQLGRALRLSAGAHRVRVEQLAAKGERSQSEFSFTVGPGDHYEHTIVPSGVLLPLAPRSRGCCATAPNSAAPYNVFSVCVLGLAVCAIRMQSARKRRG